MSLLATKEKGSPFSCCYPTQESQYLEEQESSKEGEAYPL